MTEVANDVYFDFQAEAAKRADNQASGVLQGCLSKCNTFRVRWVRGIFQH